MRSIKRYLLAWMMGALLLGGVMIALVTYVVTLNEMNEVFDADLETIAKSVGRYHRSAYALTRQDDISIPQRTDVPRDVEIVTIAWSPQGRRIYTSDPRVKVPFSSQEGMSSPLVDGEEWIVYASVGTEGVAQAAQRVSQREQMAAESGAKVFPPVFILVVVVGGLLMYGLRRGMAPLDVAARDVEARSARSLAPISDQAMPSEIKPLVRSINDLLARLATAFSAQRRFLADAAHELRTPITALKLQLQLLRRSPDDAGREASMQELERGVERAQRLVQQLLAFARSDPDTQVMTFQHMRLDQLVQSTVLAFNAKAEQRGIDLGARADVPVALQGDPEQMQVLLNNLVENALRYTPQGGTVDVEVGLQDGHPWLSVADNGPGISEHERPRVFDRFYRGADAQQIAADAGGSGLGLSIVKAVAERHSATVSLHVPEAHQGLVVRVLFCQPASPPASS
ncbi:two-component sensor histidine kinase [Aquabacterium soli]|uniref:histidine kinase n=1 Tax=Aquabacterium soli TaxID=2493092 RepID=A0A3R8S0X3_9BURK|nr:ATP-binding protein [Aquabacterium soli]RRS02814.1 two-component sensor histidine kinase [Aquabacterium soli]